jgi:hypothetical protein
MSSYNASLHIPMYCALSSVDYSYLVANSVFTGPLSQFQAFLTQTRVYMYPHQTQVSALAYHTQPYMSPSSSKTVPATSALPPGPHWPRDSSLSST